MAKTTKTYILTSKHHSDDGTIMQAGEKIELTESQAKFMTGKITDPSDIVPDMQQVDELLAQIEGLEKDLVDKTSKLTACSKAHAEKKQALIDAKAEIAFLRKQLPDGGKKMPPKKPTKPVKKAEEESDDDLEDDDTGGAGTGQPLNIKEGARAPEADGDELEDGTDDVESDADGDADDNNEEL